MADFIEAGRTQRVCPCGKYVYVSETDPRDVCRCDEHLQNCAKVTTTCSPAGTTANTVIAEQAAAPPRHPVLHPITVRASHGPPIGTPLRYWTPSRVEGPRVEGVSAVNPEYSGVQTFQRRKNTQRRSHRSRPEMLVLDNGRNHAATVSHIRPCGQEDCYDENDDDLTFCSDCRVEEDFAMAGKVPHSHRERPQRNNDFETFSRQRRPYASFGRAAHSELYLDRRKDRHLRRHHTEARQLRRGLRSFEFPHEYLGDRLAGAGHPQALQPALQPMAPHQQQQLLVPLHMRGYASQDAAQSVVFVPVMPSVPTVPAPIPVSYNTTMPQTVTQFPAQYPPQQQKCDIARKAEPCIASTVDCLGKAIAAPVGVVAKAIETMNDSCSRPHPTVIYAGAPPIGTYSHNYAAATPVFQAQYAPIPAPEGDCCKELLTALGSLFDPNSYRQQPVSTGAAGNGSRVGCFGNGGGGGGGGSVSPYSKHRPAAGHPIVLPQPVTYVGVPTPPPTMMIGVPSGSCPYQCLATSPQVRRDYLI